MSAPSPIRFLYPVRIKHKATERYLVSGDFRYQHGNSSGQQLIGASMAKEEYSIWTFKHPNAATEIPALGARFVSDDIVRIEHASTKKNLHSHQRQSPVSSQQEVTAFGGFGVGDDNDEWELRVQSVSEDGSSAEIVLKHKVTGMFLHSHKHRLQQPPLPDLHEVTAFDGEQDANNTWIVESQGDQPLELSRVHTEVSITERMLSFTAESTTTLSHWAEAAETWVQKEAEKWSWLTGLGNGPTSSDTPTIQPLLTNFQSGFRRIQKAIKRVRQEHDSRNLGDALTAFQNELAQVYAVSSGLPYSREPSSLFVSDLSAKNPFTAAVACSILAGMNPAINSANGIRGVCAAIDFERGEGARTENAHSVAFDHFRSSLQSRADQLMAILQNDRDSIGQQIATVDREANQFSKRAEALITSATASFAALESALRDKISLDGSIEYWKERAKNSRTKAGTFGKWTGQAMLASFLSILFAAYALFGLNLSPSVDRAAKRNVADVNTNQSLAFPAAAPTPIGTSESPRPESQRLQDPTGQYWRYFVLAVLLTFEVWGCRILARIAISSLHTAEDADERVTMLQTFLSLSSDQSVDRKDDVKLILQTVFRPGSTGLIQEDTGIQTPLEMVLKNVSGDARSGSGRSNS